MKTSSIIVLALLLLAFAGTPAPPNVKSKFYDFGDQVIDGEIKRPTGLYSTTRANAKFDRLLRLKKSFLPKLFLTAKEKVFK